jgi:hypothetical protein
MRDHSAGTDCRLSGDRGLTCAACWSFWISSTSQRATNPNQNALSLALPASAARRRHSSARRRKCSILTYFLPSDRPISLLFLRSETQPRQHLLDISWRLFSTVSRFAQKPLKRRKSFSLFLIIIFNLATIPCGARISMGVIRNCFESNTCIKKLYQFYLLLGGRDSLICVQSRSSNQPEPRPRPSPPHTTLGALYLDQAKAQSR